MPATDITASVVASGAARAAERKAKSAATFRSRYSSLSDQVFKRTCESVRQLRGLPDRTELVSLAYKNAKIAARGDEGERWNSAQLYKMASEVADRIIKNFNPEKFRPAPKSSRLERSIRDAKIRQRYLSAQENGEPVPVRTLATEFGLSHNQINRILRAAGISPRHDAAVARLSPAAQHVLAVSKQMLPNDGRVAFYKEAIASLVLGGHSTAPVRLEDLNAVLFEIESAKLGLHIYLWDEAAHGVMVRGRKLSAEQAAAWLQGQLKERNVPRTPRYLFKHSRGEEYLDLAAVLAVGCGDYDESTLRRFFLASIETADPTPYLRVIRYAARESCVDLVVDRLHKAGEARPFLQDILSDVGNWIHAAERSCSCHDPWTVLQAWIVQTKYLERIGTGSLWNRSEGGVREILAFAETTDEPLEVIKFLMELGQEKENA